MTTISNTPRLRHGLGFLLGFGFAFLPGYGPFFGLLFFLSTRWQLRRHDLWWWSAALLCGLPLMLAPDTWWQGVLSSVQIIVAWLLYRAFGHLYGVRQALPAVHERSMRWGLLAGLALVVSLGWWQIEALNLGAAKTIAQAIVWRSPPSLYGHAVLVLGALMAVLMPQAGLRVISLGLAALGILVSGSREAAIAWVIVALALFVLHSGRSRRSFWLELSLLIIMFGVAIGLSPYLGWGRVGFLLDLDSSVQDSSVDVRQNLIQGSEIADGDWWDALGVSVTEREAEFNGQSLTVYDLAKLEPESWRRLQQAVTLEPGQPYVLSAYIHSDPTARPSLQGWGRVDSVDSQDPNQNASTFIVIGEMLAGRWHASVSGPGQVRASDSVAIDDTWRRVWINFVYTGDSPLIWWVGMAPDRREQADTSSAFAGFQLEPAVSMTETAPSPYRPGVASQGLGLQVARLPYWRAAWQGFLERPWLGQDQPFSRYFLTQGYSSKIQQPPSHVHNLFLQFLFTRGIVGLSGLMLLLAALIYPLVQRRDVGMLTVVSALLIANLFDYSFFYGAVLYPLVAVAGWRASQSSQVSLGRGQLGVSLYLSLVDLAVAYLTFALAHAFMYGDGRLLIDWSTLALPAAVRYGLLLYPLLFWRNGLYPGYGLTAAQELRKQVSGSSYAILALAVVRLAFQDGGNNPSALMALLLMWFFGLVAYPAGRAVSKRLLHLLGLWGRAVVILGAGTAGQRVAKALCNAPLDGLQPIAFFDDDPAKIGRVIQGLPVVGSLSYADVYASKRAIRHAIVAIPTAPASVMSALVSRKGRVFTWLQFVPELPGLPAEDVYTGNLDGLLALEVRNGLYAQTSRVFKRSIDLLGATLGGMLIAPLLLLIYLWVRLDSAGGAFHWSARIGEGGQPFRCLKFRTMHVDAEARLASLLEHDPALRAEYGRYHKLEHDPRITRAGRILRKFSLDELSQLYNVIIGEMSLIGPRPYLALELDDMGEYAKTILLAKPGMTGYWQVSGRSNVSFGERLEMEAHYVRNWSIWWDIILLLHTVRVVLGRQGAH